MIRQREVKTKHNTPPPPPPRAPQKQNTKTERRQTKKKVCELDMFSLYYVVYAKTNGAPCVHSTHVLGPPVYRPGVTKWPLFCPRTYLQDSCR